MDRIETEKSLRLIDYLKELVALRSKVVYDIRNYESVLWLCDVPKQKGCFTQAWGASEDAPEIWLEVKKHTEPPVPEIPEVCEDWANKESLYDSEEFPKLFSTIQQESEIEVDGEISVSTEYLEISNFPKVQKAWDAYLEKLWLPWMERHQVWKQIHNVYKKLFEIHHHQQKLGEEYELVLGLGLLQWHVPNDQIARRHLVTAKANLEFDTKSGKFTLMADEEGAKLDIELNMLGEYQPVSAVGSIKASFEVADDNPWDRNMIESVLSSLANVIGEGNGEYCAELTYDSSITSKPKVFFAPALILRKRSVRGLEMVLDQMKELLKNKESAPDWFNDLCEKKRITKNRGDSVLSEDMRGKPSDHELEDGTIYFPLPSNSQQRQIVEKWQSTDGILVQGPPGTGKSLSIANLICHLLAIGQRVLVTAKTPRALKVLHGLLPEEVGALCVSLLGRGVEEREDLKKSIGHIHSRESEWNLSVSQNRVNDLKKELNSKRAEKAKIEAKIRNLRERDAGHHVILDGKYSGTAAQIGNMLNKQKAEFEWFTDDAGDNFNISITKNKLITLREELLFFSSSDAQKELSYEHVDTSELPLSEEVRKFITQEISLQEEMEEIAPLLDERLERVFQETDKGLIKDLLGSLDSLFAETKTVLNRPYEWMQKAVSEILSDRDTPWKALEDVTEQKIKGLKSRTRRIDGQSLNCAIDLQEDKLLNDCRKLSEYIEKGGSWGWWVFKSREIKRLRYIVEHISIDGEKCDSVEILEKIIEYLEVKADVRYLWNLWQRQVGKVDGPLFIQVAHLEEALEALSAAVGLYDKMEEARHAVKRIEGLQEPAWHSTEEVYKLCCACRIVLNQAKLKEIRSKIADMVFLVDSISKKPRMHPCISEIANSIRERDCVRYSEMFAQAEEIEKITTRWENLKKIEDFAQNHFPKLIKLLKSTFKDQAWEIRLERFEAAYNWACAKKWLIDYLSEDNLPSLHTRLKQCESKISSLLSQLAAEKAWSFCLSRMTEEQGRNLRMFSRVRIPKSGKTVLRKRREAQKYLNNCREAVPAWIMPLHRVYDTIAPSAEKFDVIIVDEASQCGQEALPLFFLARKIIIVGDNNQISPMSVGVKEELIQQLIQRYLYDFEYKETFEPKKSLFDQAFFRFPARNQIRLREHFRCMPEIIRFSNDLCYSDQPLIPLRQFSSQRLDPLKRVYIQNGYREGTSSHVQNRPEAEAVVEAIVSCCADDDYQDKTMGVIVLQGHAQDRLIEDMLLKELDAEEIENRRLICGDPYSFQGDERDIIFLSMVAAPNERNAVLAHEIFVRSFNVAASRARDQMWLFHSVQLQDLGLTCLRRKLLSFFMGHLGFGVVPQQCTCENINELRHQALTANRSLVRSPEPFESWFEVDVFLDLVNKQYKVLPQYSFAGKRIDLVVEGSGGEQLAVECYGDYWHGADQYEKDILRQRQLERCGWKFHIIRECEYRYDRTKCVEMLLAELKHRGIQPRKATETLKESFDKETIDEITAIPQISTKVKDTYLSNVQQAFGLKAKDLQKIIVEVLSKRPNKTCVKDKLHTYILKELGIVTRGAPRQKFARKVDQSVRHLAKKRQVEVYKSKNERVRLLVDYSSLF